MEHNDNDEEDEYGNDEEGGVKCENYELCKTILPNWWFECKNNYLCTNCHMLFGSWGSGENQHYGRGVLQKYDNKECHICFNYKRSMSYPRCEHTSCIDCLRIHIKYSYLSGNILTCPLCRA